MTARHMPAKSVRVLPALDPGESYTEPDFLLVETFRNERGQPVSRIDHISGGRLGAGVTDWVVSSLGGLTHLSHTEAMQWAIAYASAFGIPVVYERDENPTADGPTSVYED